MRAPLIAGAAGLAAFALLHFRDPHVEGAYGFCPFLVLTGQPCPGCGGLRAVNLLTRGEVAAAVSSNLFAVSARERGGRGLAGVARQAGARPARRATSPGPRAP